MQHWLVAWRHHPTPSCRPIWLLYVKTGNKPHGQRRLRSHFRRRTIPTFPSLTSQGGVISNSHPRTSGPTLLSPLLSPTTGTSNHGPQSHHRHAQGTPSGPQPPNDLSRRHRIPPSRPLVHGLGQNRILLFAFTWGCVFFGGGEGFPFCLFCHSLKKKKKKTRAYKHPYLWFLLNYQDVSTGPSFTNPTAAAGQSWEAAACHVPGVRVSTVPPAHTLSPQSRGQQPSATEPAVCRTPSLLRGPGPAKHLSLCPLDRYE